MAKHDTRKTSGQAGEARGAQPVTIQVPFPVLGIVNGVREALHGLCIATGLPVLETMMEADRQVLCGPKGRHQVERAAWRGGSADSQVTLGGRQVELPRLRVRSADGEVPLASFEWAAATDPLNEHTMAAVAAGVSTRQYASTLDPVPADVSERGTSSSAVSRRFVALSTKTAYQNPTDPAELTDPAEPSSRSTPTTAATPAAATAMPVPTIHLMSRSSSAASSVAISARTSTRPDLNWSEVTWSPCSRPSWMALAITSAWSRSTPPAASCRATVSVSNMPCSLPRG